MYSSNNLSTKVYTFEIIIPAIRILQSLVLRERVRVKMMRQVKCIYLIFSWLVSRVHAFWIVLRSVVVFICAGPIFNLSGCLTVSTCVESSQLTTTPRVPICLPTYPRSQRRDLVTISLPREPRPSLRMQKRYRARLLNQRRRRIVVCKVKQCSMCVSICITYTVMCSQPVDYAVVTYSK